MSLVTFYAPDELPELLKVTAPTGTSFVAITDLGGPNGAPNRYVIARSIMGAFKTHLTVYETELKKDEVSELDGIGPFMVAYYYNAR